MLFRSGSACGKALGAVPSTTLGYERIANWAFQIGNQDEFVREVLAGQPEPPAYFAVMKTVNRDGPPPRPATEFKRIDAAALGRHLARGTRVVDVRPTREFAAAHVPGTINIPLSKSFTTWAGSLVPYDRDIVLLAEERENVDRAVSALSLIGHDRIVGWGDHAVREEWRAAGKPLDSTAQVEPAAVVGHDVQLVDVRASSEWNAGHAPGAQHFFLGNLEKLADSLSRDTPIVTQCQGGSRSAIAASVLRAHGFKNVSNMHGGFDAWKRAGLPVEK